MDGNSDMDIRLVRQILLLEVSRARRLCGLDPFTYSGFASSLLHCPKQRVPEQKSASVDVPLPGA
jgi:hypothetical protein